MMDRIVTLTATIKAREGQKGRVESALAELVRWVDDNEPLTLAYHVSRGVDDPTVFTTFERFASESAMASHHGSVAVAQFVGAVADCLAGPIEIRVCRELVAITAREASEPKS